MTVNDVSSPPLNATNYFLLFFHSAVYIKCYFFLVLFYVPLVCRIVQHGCADAELHGFSYRYIVVWCSLRIPFPETRASVSSLKVSLGTYPSSVFIFITAAPDVRLKILAFGHRRRASWKDACLMRFANSNPAKIDDVRQSDRSCYVLHNPP